MVAQIYTLHKEVQYNKYYISRTLSKVRKYNTYEKSHTFKNAKIQYLKKSQNFRSAKI